MNKKYYIIGVSRDIAGLLAIVDSVMNHVCYALRYGLTPIVDMKHFPNQYFKDNREFKDNSWEYFFKQPMDENLDSINKNSQVQISANSYLVPNEPWFFDLQCVPVFEKDFSNNYSEIKEIFCKYIKFKPEIKDILEKNYQNITGGNKNILGILCRGTDYSIKKTIGEAKQPKISEVFKKTDYILKKFPQIQKIYLATEDDDIYKQFKKKYKNLLIENNQYKYSFKKDKSKYLSQIKVNRKNHNYQLALEYLSSVYLLSKCNFLIGGRCNGTKTAWLMSNGFKYFYCWKLGIYKRPLLKKLFSTKVCYKGRKRYRYFIVLGVKIRIPVGL